MTARPVLHSFWCDRCGKPFQAPLIVLDCPACMYAQYRQRFITGHQPTGAAS